ncbi:hypothetical protein LTS18_000889, partial [Coniosporium uncinatum]
PHFSSPPKWNDLLQTTRHIVEDDGYIRPGEKGYFAGLDSFAAAGDKASLSAENVALVGYEGGLKVYDLVHDRDFQKHELKLLAKLDNVRGSVIGAKILPWTSRQDPLAAQRPLVALIVHGPVLDKSRASQHNGSSSSSAVGSDEHSGSSESPSRAPSIKDDEAAPQLVDYQTTVEIHSLSTQELVETLYATPRVASEDSLDSPYFKPPSPVGHLKVDVNGKFVVVSSGHSGEVFVFAPYTDGHAVPGQAFRCLGKFWTSLQQRDLRSSSSASNANDTSHPSAGQDSPNMVPLISLSHRWLALVPPASSSIQSLNGTALLPPSGMKPPGLATYTAPLQPAISCEVDVPDREKFFNRVSREVTQGLIKGANWLGTEGVK